MVRDFFKAMACALGVALGLLFGLSGSAQAGWLRAESPNFIVYGELPEAELRERTVRLENFDQALRFLSGNKDPRTGRKAEVFLVLTSQINDVMRRDAGEILGFYKATADATAFIASTEDVAVARATTNTRMQVKRVYLSSDSVLQHEYAHHFMFQHFNAAYPAWYREGFAEYVSTVEISPSGLLLGKASYGRALGLSNWISARRFMQVTPESDPEDLYSSYVQGWITTHYFYSSVELNRSLGAFLAATTQGEPVEAALTKSIGVGFDDLDRAVRAYVDNVKLRQFPGWKPVQVDVRIAPVSDAHGAVLLDDVGIRLQLGAVEARIKALREARAKFPQDPDVALALARALLAGGLADEVESLVSGAAETADVLTLRADALLLQAGKSEDASVKDAKRLQARRLYARANKLDPESIASLIGYVETLPAAEQISENALNVRMLAHALAPQVSELTIGAAYYLMKAERYEDAADLLPPVAFNAHGGESARYAGALLKAAKAGQPPIAWADWRKQQAAAPKQP